MVIHFLLLMVRLKLKGKQMPKETQRERQTLMVTGMVIQMRMVRHLHSGFGWDLLKPKETQRGKHWRLG